MIRFRFVLILLFVCSTEGIFPFIIAGIAIAKKVAIGAKAAAAKGKAV